MDFSFDTANFPGNIGDLLTKSDYRATNSRPYRGNGGFQPFVGAAISRSYPNPPFVSSNIGSAAQSAALAQQRGAQARDFQSALDNALASGDDTQLRTACRDFESYFLQIMFREMRKTTFAGEDGGAAGLGGKAAGVFRDMLDEEYSKSAAKAGGIGLAEMMYRQMKRTGEAE